MIMIAKKVLHCGLEYPGLEGVAPFVPPSKFGSPQNNQATLQLLGYIVFVAAKLIVSLSAIDCVDCMGRSLGWVY
jgi:hypothetical protein